jgi:uncharacterized protein (TIGR02117 family)
MVSPPSHAPARLPDMPPLKLGFVLALTVSCLGGCAARLPQVSRANFGEIETNHYKEVSFSYPTPPPQETIVYLVRHGWHTGLILPVAEISERIWPEVGDYRDFDYVEFGWGDERTYKDHHLRMTAAVKAAFLPTSSVLHVVGSRGSVLDFYTESDITEIRFTPTQFENVCRYISNSFARDEQGRAEFVGPGRYGEARFYKARGKYYVFKTCNVWTARALQAAELPVIPRLSLSAVSVMKQSRLFGQVLQQHPQRFKLSDPVPRTIE